MSNTPNVLIVEGVGVASNLNCCLVNVYAPQERSAKKVLWDFISSFINHRDVACICFGDFDAVRDSLERMGTRFCHYSSSNFNNFISSLSIVDVRLGGFAFTRSNVHGSKLAKLDRFLLQRMLLNCFLLSNLLL